MNVKTKIRKNSNTISGLLTLFFALLAVGFAGGLETGNRPVLSIVLICITLVCAGVCVIWHKMSERSAQ